MMEYKRNCDVDIRIVRIFNTYGPNLNKNDGRVVSNFINQAIENREITVYGDGKQTRSFCYVDDLVRGLVLLMNSETNIDTTQPINLGNPCELTMLELASIIIDLTNSQSEIIFKELPKDDPLQRKPDISKAKRY